ncbi:MAG: tyrosine-type recombinase/integrase [Melioribacteraceae bacterium]|nr:tyrosine-type recombinase/integrase [Melioribacteraceae bacterium]
MFISKSKKSPFYQLTYEVNGKRTTISTKTKNPKEAYSFLANFQLQKEQPKKQTDCFLLSKFKDEYIEFVTPIKSKKYLISISSSFKQLIAFCGDIPLNEIDIRILDKFITSTFSRTKRGAHHYYRTLKAAFNKAVEWNYISINPFTKIKFPKMQKSFPLFLNEDELLIILANTAYQHLKDIFTVGFYTGLRLGEIINMRWDWVDFHQNQITVKCTDQFQTKNKKERIVPMTDKVISVLLSRFYKQTHPPHELVFYRIRNKTLYQESISKQFKKIIRKSNLNDKIHFHTLRHSFASLLVQRGVSLFVVKELLGHEDLATTQIYSHLQQQNLRDAVNLL